MKLSRIKVVERRHQRKALYLAWCCRAAGTFSIFIPYGSSAQSPSLKFLLAQGHDGSCAARLAAVPAGETRLPQSAWDRNTA